MGDARMQKKRKKGRKTQAPALSTKLWGLWLEWLKSHTNPRVYFCVFLTGALGLRCSEALALKREDLHLTEAVPSVRVTGQTPGARKSPGDVYVRKQHLQQLRCAMADGLDGTRVVKHKHGKGARKTIVRKEHFDLPEKGYIFAGRQGAKAEHMGYQAIYNHIVKQAPLFYKAMIAQGEKVSHDAQRLRPHSGRATLITELMGEGLTTAMSMKYARHAPGSYKVHLRYGQLSLADVKRACDAAHGSRKRTKWSTWRTKDLLAAQAAIQKELSFRIK